ncbi:repressor of RNA polymerase III transcription [Tieghemostelium lacteum]|uniref:Repressor of RNA polymerase III transcription n=1 Tax=Tieghemostelium lacteum TaxID=361077 RepID=A0A152A4Z4_TIELA|nr:repressor of RNA polymerase III transcription [Tieghemostelium lacteum]|eukprot:KYR01316.1 repressor of RNA polymerase III transcription [Tieghemostelium lacteum]
MIDIVGVNSKLSTVDIGEGIFTSSIECYSCKTDGTEKKLYKSLDKELETLGQQQQQQQLSTSNGGSFNNTNLLHIFSNNNHNNNSNNNTNNNIPISLSPNPLKHELISVSPFGPMSSSASRKVMIYLIQTLNASFVDYDFNDSKPNQFRLEPNQNLVRNSIDTSLLNVIGDYNSELKDKLWSSIDSAIETEKSVIYSYIPEYPDPFTEDGVVILFFKGKLISKLNNSENLIITSDDEM